ncbi:MAG TPA: class I SAM-dependent methyltransferase [Pseudomonadales bacterium]
MGRLALAKALVLDILCAEADERQLEALAGQFRFARRAAPGAEFHLAYDAHRLELVRHGDRKGIAVERPEIERRLQGQFLLGRACGIRRGHPLRVLDATAGMGVDGLALALSGQSVRLVEREPALWALLADLLRRFGPVSGDVDLTLGDARTFLARSAEIYDVVYFDPMFPARSKTALPGKRMQYLSALLGETPPIDTGTIELARHRARSRVVLKRRAKDPVLGRPDWTIRGRAVRYDVYRGAAADPGTPGGPDQPSSRMA